MKKDVKISLIIPYFGKLPALSQLFFFTCGWNKNLLFLLFTDQKRPEELPENVKYHYMTLKDFNQLASQKLGVKIKIVYPYKLCDLKPMYGKIFENYLTDTFFWGYCDLDMILGNSHEFLKPDLLTNYDIITARKNSLAGNFTLFKNIESINHLFLQSDCWREIITDPWLVYCFDEKFKPNGEAVSKNVFYRLFKPFHVSGFGNKITPDMNTVLCTHLKIKVHYGDFILSDMMLKNKGFVNWELHWENGILKEKDTNQSYLYFHFYFLKHKATYFSQIKIDYQLIKSITITSKSIEINY